MSKVDFDLERTHMMEKMPQGKYYFEILGIIVILLAAVILFVILK